MNYLVDSDYLIDALAGVPTAVALLSHLAEEDVAISILDFGELFEGAFGDGNSAQKLAYIRAFLSSFSTLQLTDSIMERFARIRSDLRRTGMLIPDLDLLIAATASVHDLALVTRNARHFERVSGLTIYR